MARNKKQKKRSTWTKRRHTIVFALLRPILGLYFRLRYNFKAKHSGLRKSAYLIISNHQTTMDPFLLSLSFRFPIYFVASDDLFNLKVSPLINYLVAPIPKSKSLCDVAAMMGVLRVIREGGAVGIFPEGNRTVSGGQWEMTDAIAKLAKKLKVPLVIYNICGGYGTDPRWGHSIRKGRASGGVRRIISVEELSALSNEQLFTLIKEELMVNDTESGVSFRSRKRAEYIERALYMCPVCHKISGIVSHKHKFECKHCGTGAVYTKNLTISPAVAGVERICDWYEWERKEIVKAVIEGKQIEDGNILFRESIKFKRKKKLDGDRVSIDKDKLVIYSKKKEQVFMLAKITALTMVGKKKFNFYYEGKILQVKGNKRFCAIKYVHIFNGLQLLNNEDIKED
ncbi:MAG: 1-acyl-sn-glycerol-3-phosphate acyltransferase [Anaeroplasmataceae bacterium]|nr:1-acyl-sn-glycerol-3-phosphate acyltransferase [Anaeroplasmataceae bacterium]